MDPADRRGDRPRAELHPRGEPRRAAPALRREPASKQELTTDSAELARRFLDALGRGDREAVGELVHPDVEIRTERTVHRGRDAARDWAGKVFEHLIRRYEILEVEETSSGVLVHAELDYVWRESGEVGDRSRVAIELGIRDGLISSWHLRDEPG